LIGWKVSSRFALEFVDERVYVVKIVLLDWLLFILSGCFFRLTFWLFLTFCNLFANMLSLFRWFLQRSLLFCFLVVLGKAKQFFFEFSACYLSSQAFKSVQTCFSLLKEFFWCIITHLIDFLQRHLLLWMQSEVWQSVRLRFFLFFSNSDLANRLNRLFFEGRRPGGEWHFVRVSLNESTFLLRKVVWCRVVREWEFIVCWVGCLHRRVSEKRPALGSPLQLLSRIQGIFAFIERDRP